MFVLSALVFLVASPSNREIKIVFVDGAIETGPVRSIRGRIVKEDDTSITLERSNGRITIGRAFIIKIEDWNTHRRGEHGY